MPIKFNKYAVTDGALKARVTYNAHRPISSGALCVTIYAKDFASGRALAAMIGDGYENNSDIQSDYFEKGLVRIPLGHPLFPAAHARAVANGAGE